jgi:hypothetical protein
VSNPYALSSFGGSKRGWAGKNVGVPMFPCGKLQRDTIFSCYINLGHQSPFLSDFCTALPPLVPYAAVPTLALSYRLTRAWESHSPQKPNLCPKFLANSAQFCTLFALSRAESRGVSPTFSKSLSLHQNIALFCLISSVKKRRETHFSVNTHNPNLAPTKVS